MIDRERIEADVRMIRSEAPDGWRAPAWLVLRIIDHCEQLLAALAAAEAENARLRESLAETRERLDERRRDWVALQEGLDALASRPGEEVACERCHGDGVITVGGTSVNPHTGMRGPDPQAADDAVCPDCAGTGGDP